jgi:tripartite-type tricarboxylate transporter receptor subunit TctC
MTPHPLFQRRLLGAALLTALLSSPLAWAQNSGLQADRPIRLVVGLAAGGSLDAQARAVAKRMAEISGMQVIVDNKPGASMMISALEVKKAKPDGHTLLFAPSSVFTQNPHTLSNVQYNPFTDFTPVSIISRGPLVLTVHQSLGVRTVPELLTWAKAHPGQLNFASFGTGTSSHIYAEAFGKTGKVPITHIPYKGTADAASDLLEGRVQAYFDAAPTAIQNAQTGKIVIIGVASAKRYSVMPNVPTISEQGMPGLDLTSWLAVVGPAGMSADTTRKLNDWLKQSLQTPTVKDFIAKGAYEASPSTPAELAQEMKTAYDRWGEMVKMVGLVKQ